MRRNHLRLTAIVGICLLAVAGLAFGQAKSGNIYGRVVAEDGSALPGVTVTLTGGGAPQVFVSDSRGDFRFLNLAPSSNYNLKFELDNFSTVERKDVEVNTGQNTDIRVAMKLAQVEASVTVSGEAPLLDTRKVGTGATITREEMDAIPSARDPWVVVQTVPGVQVDRVNTGGNQSGQQSLFIAKGSQISQGSWNLDGVNVSDLGSGNSSPTYWDFDSFQEIQAVTGGNDPSVSAMGVTLNMVTKRGTNDLHGSARVFVTSEKFQADPDLTAEMERQQAASGGVAAFTGNRIQAIQDYGAEVGGPIIRDRAWLWGAYARNQIDWITATGLSDKTTLEDINGKLNLQVLDSNALTAYFLRGDKIKFGREASTQRPQPTSRDQNGPSSLYKIEDSHVFSSNLFATLQYSYFDEAFQLVAQGGSVPQAFRGSDDVWQRSFASAYFRRPQHQLLGSTSLFFNTGTLGHELKLGASYRKGSVGSETIWPGGGVIGFAAGATGGCNVACAALTRQSNAKVALEQIGIYLSDVMKMDRLTVSLGRPLRLPGGTRAREHGSGERALPRHPSGGDGAGRGRRHHVREHLAPTRTHVRDRQEPLHPCTRELRAVREQPLGVSGQPALRDPGRRLPLLRLEGRQQRPDRRSQRGRTFPLRSSPPSTSTRRARPTRCRPTRWTTTSRRRRPTKFVVGLDHELMPNFAVGVAYTYRKYDNFYFWTRYNSSTGQALFPEDYVFHHNVTGTLPDGTAFTAPGLQHECPRPVPPGRFFLNRPDYTQTFNGVELTLTKRLSNGWMARASGAWNDSRQQVGSRGCFDPTNVLYNHGEDSVNGMCEDDGIVAPNAGGGSGAFGNVNLNSRWQFNVNGMYQLPLGFGVAANYFIREGYPIGWYVIDTSPSVANGGDGIQRRINVTPVEDHRYNSVDQLDLRIDKTLNITSSVSMVLSADLFNALNDNTVLQRNSRIGLPSPSTGTNTVFEIQSPRVFRFGAKLSF